MDITNSLGVIVFVCCLVVGIFVVPEIFKWLNNKKFKKQQEKCIDIMHFKYLCSSKDEYRIYDFYINDLENTIWFKIKENMKNGFVKESQFMRSYVKMDDIRIQEILNQR